MRIESNRFYGLFTCSFWGARRLFVFRLDRKTFRES